MALTKLDLMKGLDPLLPHLVATPRGKGGEIGKIRQDLEAFVARLVGDSVRPELLSWDPLGVEDTDPVQVTFKGRNLIPPGWGRASLVRDNGVANSALLWTAILPGECGNNITIQYATDTDPVHISASGNAVLVTLETGVTTAADVITELALHPEVARMVSAALYGTGNTGAGKPTVMAATNLAGGTGARLLTADLLMAQGSNKDLYFRARVPGAPGDAVSIAFVNNAAYTVPSVACSGSAITVTLKAGTTTAATVLAALRAHTNTMLLIDADLAEGSSGAGAPAAFSHTHLSRHLTEWNAGWIPLLGNQRVTATSTYGYDSITDDTAVVTFQGVNSPQVITGITVVELPTCDTVHRVTFTAAAS